MNIDLINSINSFRKGNPNYITNTFLSVPQLQVLLANQKTRLEKSKDAILILHDKYDFFQGYFFARNISELMVLTKKTNYLKKPLLIDIIGKEIDAFKIVSQFENYGLELYGTYIRMACKKSWKFKESTDSVILASKEDSTNIYNLLYKEFDHFDAHLPTLNEIEQAIDKGEILVVKNDDCEIIGLAYFQQLGARSSYLRELMVVKKFRGKGVADMLMRYILSNTNNGVNVSLWVKSSNISAIKKYEKFGFIKDGLVDCIMLYKGDA